MEKRVRVEAGRSIGRLLHKSRREMMVPQDTASSCGAGEGQILDIF